MATDERQTQMLRRNASVSLIRMLANPKYKTDKELLDRIEGTFTEQIIDEWLSTDGQGWSSSEPTNARVTLFELAVEITK